MAVRRAIIPFFTDQCVPDSVGDIFADAGHQLTRLRDVMDIESPDPIIAVACSRHGQVLVTHDTDFRNLARRLNLTQRQYHNSLHRIQLRCPEPESAGRVSEALSLIESEWKLTKLKRPMIIEVNSKSFVTRR